MRGTPFYFENFSKGLNTIDSPYTLEPGESRDLMNVVSTTRGSIKKRYGSSAFASGTSATFPTLAATDSFIRANENPLKKDGKGNESAWVVLPFGDDTGKIKTNVWEGLGSVSFLTEGGYYSVAEQTNPAVSIELTKLPEITEAEFGPICCTAAVTETGYKAVFKEETAKGEKYKLTLIRSDEGTEETLATVEKITLAVKASIGIAVRAGIVTVWKKPTGGSWEKLTEAADATYTKGYSGFRYRTKSAAPKLQLNNFATGEMGAPVTEAELTSMAAVNIGGTRYLIVSNGKEIWSCQTNGTLIEIGKSFTAGTFWSIVQAEKGAGETAGPVYLSNGTDAPQYWTGAEAKTTVKEWKSSTTEKEEEQYVATPKAKYLLWAANRMWASGITADPSAVRFTELITAGAGGATGDPTEWAEDNVVRFDPEDGNPITGLGRVGPYILVFKANKTWVIFDLDTGENRKLSDSTGCVAHRSIAESEAGTFFLSADQGVYVTNGSNLKEVSYSVRPTLLAINPAKREQAAGAYFNNHYYLSFASETSTVANRTVDYDLGLKSWWLHDLTSNQWTPFEATTGEPFLFIIPPEVKAGIVKAFDPAVYTDRTAVYTGNGRLSAWWISAWDPFGYYVFRHRVKAPMLKKRVRQVFFDGEGEIIPSVYRNFSVGERQEPAVVGNDEIATEDTKPVDFNSGVEKWVENEGVWGVETPGTEILWGGETSVGSARLYSPGVARVWGVGWGNKSDKGFTVHSYAFMASFRKS